MRLASRDRVRRDDAARCRALLRQGSKSFHAASLLLPRRVRDAAAAVYAFCRIADDAIDLGPEPEAGLAELHHRLDRVYGAAPAADFIDRALGVTVRRYAIPRGVFEALLEGFAWELEDRRYESADDLNAYCVRVAATVGVVMARVMGCRDPETLARACDLGVAMQLTNIARDVREDAEACRVYLPAERLGEYGVSQEDLVDGEADDQAVSVVVSDVLDLAERYYESGDAGMHYLPSRARWAVLVASRLYRGIGRRLRQRHRSNPMFGRVVVPWVSKLGLLASATWSWFRLSWFPPMTRPVLPYREYPLDVPETSAGAGRISAVRP